MSILQIKLENRLKKSNFGICHLLALFGGVYLGNRKRQGNLFD
jgi:hypothetical protein